MDSRLSEMVADGVFNSFSLYVGYDRLGWSFHSLWAARHVAEDAAAAGGVRVDVVYDYDGFVCFSFERGADGRTRCTYADPDALQVLQEGAIYNQDPAPVGA